MNRPYCFRLGHGDAAVELELVPSSNDHHGPRDDDDDDDHEHEIESSSSSIATTTTTTTPPCTISISPKSGVMDQDNTSFLMPLSLNLTNFTGRLELRRRRPRDAHDDNNDSNRNQNNNTHNNHNNASSTVAVLDDDGPTTTTTTPSRSTQNNDNIINPNDTPTTTPPPPPPPPPPASASRGTNSKWVTLRKTATPKEIQQKHYQQATATKGDERQEDTELGQSRPSSSSSSESLLQTTTNDNVVQGSHPDGSVPIDLFPYGNYSFSDEGEEESKLRNTSESTAAIEITNSGSLTINTGDENNGPETPAINAKKRNVSWHEHLNWVATRDLIASANNNSNNASGTSSGVRQPRYSATTPSNPRALGSSDHGADSSLSAAEVTSLVSNNNHGRGTPQKASVGTLWTNLLSGYTAAKHIPKAMRKRRAQGRAMDLGANPTSSTIAAATAQLLPPTQLHVLCEKADVSLAELDRALNREPSSVSVRDGRDRFPLHVLGDNDALVSTPHGKQVASAFAWKLMVAYPDAMTATDKDGHMPFVTLVADWVFCNYETHMKNSAVDPLTTLDVVTGTLGAVTGMLGFPKKGISEHKTAHRMSLASPSRTAVSAMTGEMRDNIIAKSTGEFPKVELWEEVEWCFAMLSVMIDELGGKNGKIKDSAKCNDLRGQLADHVVEVLPNLLKTVLLLESEGGEVRRRILRMSLFRRIIICPTSVGDWLPSMLREGGMPSKRAVDYFELVSDTRVEDYTGGWHTAEKEDEDEYRAAVDAVFVAVGELEDTISSLVVLDNNETERAAATPIVWRIMTKKLGRPFVLGLVLMDLVLHITLMMAFRSDVQISSEGLGQIVGTVPTQVVIFISSHYFLRKACEAFALLTVSFEVFRKYFLDVWTLFDLMAIVLTLGAIVWNDNNPGTYRNGFNAFVLGLLWIKVLGFLKVVNKQMATFITALIIILGDIKFFLIVLGVIIFMFGDLFYIAVSTKDDGAFCETEGLEGPTQDFCSRNRFSSYLRVYSMLLGDFELNDLRDSNGITTLFVIFTLIGVVILLNVLIAVISDSYEKATISGSRLFGRVRVTLIAQNEALEAFLTPGTSPLVGLDITASKEKFFEFISRLLRWLVLLGIIATAIYAELFLATQCLRVVRDGEQSLVLIGFIFVISFILATAIWVLFTFATEGVIRPHLSARFARWYDGINSANIHVVVTVSSWIFGTRNGADIPLSYDDNKLEDEWTGRLSYLEGKVEKMLQDATASMKSEITALEKRLYEHDAAMAEKQLEARMDESEHALSDSASLG